MRSVRPNAYPRPRSVWRFQAPRVLACIVRRELGPGSIRFWVAAGGWSLCAGCRREGSCKMAAITVASRRNWSTAVQSGRGPARDPSAPYAVSSRWLTAVCTLESGRRRRRAAMAGIHCWAMARAIPLKVRPLIMALNGPVGNDERACIRPGTSRDGFRSGSPARYRQVGFVTSQACMWGWITWDGLTPPIAAHASGCILGFSRAIAGMSASHSVRKKSAARRRRSRLPGRGR